MPGFKEESPATTRELNNPYFEFGPRVTEDFKKLLRKWAHEVLVAPQNPKSVRKAAQRLLIYADTGLLGKPTKGPEGFRDEKRFVTAIQRVANNLGTYFEQIV